MKIQKYLAIIKMYLIEQFSHFWNMATRTVVLAMILFIFLQIWKTVYAGKSAIDGYTIAQMIWYLTLTEVILFSTGSVRIDSLGEEIRSGAITSALLKPYHYAGREFCILLAEFISTFAIVGTAGILLAYFYVGPIQVTLIGLILTSLLIIGSAIISFLIVLSLSLLALWLEDVTALMWIYQKFLFVLGGMLVPLDFYPLWLRQITAELPTTYIMYLPAKLFIHFNLSDFIKAIVGQVIWIIVFLGILAFIYKKGLKEVTSHGG